MRKLPREMQPGGMLDLSTIRGNLLTVLFVILCCIIMWNLHHITFWLNSLVGITIVDMGDDAIRVRRFWAGIMAGVMLLIGVGNSLRIYCVRRRAVNSSKGQWYDNAELRKKDLFDEDDVEN
ncbi:hypothetical protein [Phytopseudomonas seleniipraecipitans]|uniref:hypothetical protein n=1 Tax=Phytopseudomonas seleniipraecipitans TaxID=640205 RepID=UPI00115FBC0D|nr:hypothetical protein [Pseudomonas seleniipraecipitans]NQD81216.1 hypothetical protein [Pseudomonas sp. CrR14]